MSSKQQKEKLFSSELSFPKTLKDKTLNVNQKKNVTHRKKVKESINKHDEIDPQLKKHKKWKQSLIVNKYMNTFIKKASAYSFTCIKCQDDILKKTGKGEMCVRIFILIYFLQPMKKYTRSRGSTVSKLKEPRQRKTT